MSLKEHPEYLPYIQTKDSGLDKSNQNLHMLLEKIRASQSTTLKRGVDTSEDYSFQPSNRDSKHGPTAMMLGSQIQGVKISSTLNKKLAEQISEMKGMESTHTSFEDFKEEISEIYS